MSDNATTAQPIRIRMPATFASAALSLPVLLVADLLEPVHVLATDRSRQGDVRHGGGRRRAVPVLDARRTPDDVAGADLHDRSAPLLRPTHARGDDQMLTRGMRVPGRPGSRLERHVGSGERRPVLGAKQRIDTDVAGEVLRRAL